MVRPLTEQRRGLENVKLFYNSAGGHVQFCSHDMSVLPSHAAVRLLGRIQQRHVRCCNQRPREGATGKGSWKEEN